MFTQTFILNMITDFYPIELDR